MQDFMADESQREMVFPAALAASDRRAIHAACEAVSLLHQSRGDEPERQLVVWKPGSNPTLQHHLSHHSIPMTPFDGSSGGGGPFDEFELLSPLSAENELLTSSGGALFSMASLRRSVMACRADSQPLPEEIQAHSSAHRMAISEDSGRRQGGPG